MKLNKTLRGVAVVVLVGTSSGVAACAAEGDAVPVPSWEVFKATAERKADGRTYYLVEWDRPIATVEALRRYYDERYVRPDQPGANPETGTTVRNLIVHRVGAEDDVWSRTNGVTLTYCISDTFGSDQARAESEMDEATSNWQSVINVNFVYLPLENGNCDEANAAIDIPVQPWNSGGACAFLPSQDGCLGRTLVIDFDGLDTDPDYATDAPNVTTTGVFRHELGHILGFRHEHARLLGPCFETPDWRPVTDYDVRSVMHYPWPECSGWLESKFELSTLDKLGAVQLYRLSASLTSSLL